MEIFVGSSSSELVDEKYINLAYKLGCEIALNNHTLIFGSSNKGMMGALYRGVKDNNGKVISVYPKDYNGMLEKVESYKIIEVSNTSKQLQTLVNMGDITVILPGSFGTLSELFTSIQCKKLNEHNKKIFIFNAFGFFDDILKIIDKIYEQKFDSYKKDKLYKVVNSIDELFKHLEEK